MEVVKVLLAAGANVEAEDEVCGVCLCADGLGSEYSLALCLLGGSCGGSEGTPSCWSRHGSSE